MAFRSVALILILASACVAAPAVASPPVPALNRIDFATGAVVPWTPETAPLAATAGARGSDAGERLALPDAAPPLPIRNSRFSPLMRARDLFDIARYPARAVAKLYRLDSDGNRQGTACTVQFVGPRHLLTAAHCLVDRTVGRPHPGFEIALRHDGGEDDGVLPVTAAWAPPGELTQRPSVIQVTGPVDWAADCHDVALIEVPEPAGARLGWLGMASRPDADAVLHRFSYPNESSAVRLERDVANEGLPDLVRQHLRRSLDEARRSEPDFSPANLYYEYGLTDQLHEEALSQRTATVLPGRSGSALIDGGGAVLGILSRVTSGVNYNCRLTPALIGAFASIAGLDRP